jgi:hypothetical protein
VSGLGFVAAARVVELIKRTAGKDAHARLTVSNEGHGHEREDAACQAVHRSPVSWHGVEVVKAIANDELRVGRGRKQRWDRGRWMLSVGVDDDHCLGGRPSLEELGEAGADRGSLAMVDRQA